MHHASYPAPNTGISLPRLSILGHPPLDNETTNGGCFPAVATNSSAAPQAFIMIGLDDTGKPHASWFAADQHDAAANAANMMCMAVIEVTSDIADIAATLPQGKLFESGKAFVPFVKRSTFDRLAAHLPEEYLASANERIEKIAASADYAKASKGEPAPRKHPDEWTKIAAGDVVLVSEGHFDGWWEGTVVADEGSGNYQLKWTDWPELDHIVRHITQIALLHPKFTSET